MRQAVAQDLWQPLSSLAALWSRAKDTPLRSAARQLYCCLFVGVDSTPHRQEVLQVRVTENVTALTGSTQHVLLCVQLRVMGCVVVASIDAHPPCCHEHRRCTGTLALGSRQRAMWRLRWVLPVAGCGSPPAP